MKEELKNRTFGLPVPLLKRLKKTSAAIDKPQQEIVAKGTELYLNAVDKELDKNNSKKND